MKYVIANWKMNMSMKEVTQWIENYCPFTSNLKIIIAPSNIHLSILKEVTGPLEVELASQDISLNAKGAHTGEVGAFQIKEFCKYCIVGHSELKETKEIVLRKRDLCLANDITPIVCFTDPNTASEYVAEGIVLAWEDPNNISKDGISREKPIETVMEGIRKIYSQVKGISPIIYGGSVNRQNIKNLVNISELDGVLVGNASTDPYHFQHIVEAY